MADQKPIEQVPEEPTKGEETVELADKPAETPVPAAAKPAEETPKEDAIESTEPATAAGSTPKATEAAQDATAPAATTETEATKPEEQVAPYLTAIPSLVKFFENLPGILTKVGYSEMWGVPLKDSADIPTVNVLIKFLRANDGNLSAAEEQLRKALEWRKETKPLELIESGKYSATKYGGLGYLTTYEQDGHPLVFTWNIYGAVKNMSATFGDSDEFVKWRAALMEMAVQELKMKDATTVIDLDAEKDPYRMVQVHDYLNVKFLRMDSTVKAATKKTIDVFSTAYPELLSEKFFVNVPAIMGWMFSAMKLILSRATTRKFHPISNGANLAREFPAAIAEKLPKVYGGKGPELKDEARAVPLVEDEQPKEVKEDKPAEPVAEVAAPVEEPTKEVAKEEPAKEETPKEETKEEAKEEAKAEDAIEAKEETKPTEGAEESK